MRKLLTAALLVALGLLTGCVKMHMETVIEADGSGTCAVTYAMGREVADAIAELTELNPDAMGEDEEIPSFADMTREKMEQACGEAGVKLVGHEYTDDASGNRLTMTIAFTDVTQLSSALNGIGHDGGDGQERLGIFRADDGNFVLKSVSVAAEPTADEAPAEPAEEAADNAANMQQAMQYMGVLMAHVNELDMRLAFTVPGDVISSNAPEVEGRTSIWTVNAANMMDQPDLEPEIVFASKGLKLKASEE